MQGEASIPKRASEQVEVTEHYERVVSVLTEPQLAASESMC